MYKGYKFKSKLEYYCFKQLEDNGIEFEYEQHSFTLVDKFTLDNISIESIKSKGKRVFKQARTNIQSISYKPDFVDLNKGWIIETKGMPNDAWPLRWKLFKKYVKDNGLDYDLYVPRNRKQVDESIKLIKEKYYNDKI